MASRLVALRVTSDRSVLTGRVVTLVFTLICGGAVYLLYRQDPDSFLESRVALMIYYLPCVVVYYLGCLSIESGLLPRALVVHPRRIEDGVHLITWRSIVGGGVVTVFGDTSLRLRSTLFDRYGLAPGNKVECRFSGERLIAGRARLRIVTDEPGRALDALLAGLESAGLKVELTALPGHIRRVR